MLVEIKFGFVYIPNETLCFDQQRLHYIQPKDETKHATEVANPCLLGYKTCLAFTNHRVSLLTAPLMTEFMRLHHVENTYAKYNTNDESRQGRGQEMKHATSVARECFFFLLTNTLNINSVQNSSNYVDKGMLCTLCMNLFLTANFGFGCAE